MNTCYRFQLGEGNYSWKANMEMKWKANIKIVLIATNNWITSKCIIIMKPKMKRRKKKQRKQQLSYTFCLVQSLSYVRTENLWSTAMKRRDKRKKETNKEIKTKMKLHKVKRSQQTAHSTTLNEKDEAILLWL